MADTGSRAMYEEYEMLKGAEQRKNKLIEVRHCPAPTPLAESDLIRDRSSCDDTIN